mmetsp:Transcript_35153/g.59176  ORF Transcript_35153/g.59176 Transcript_35153/m.59176 type:complete len:211 (-) Transcript_35153:681-1313(-)
MRLQVHHAAARDGRRGGHREVVHLEDHVHVGAHGDDLGVGQAQLLVVVQHRVHVLDPDGIHGPVEHEPLLVGSGVLTELAHVAGQHAVRPLVRGLVEVAVKLAHGDGLGVEHDDAHFVVLCGALLGQERHGPLQGAVAAALAPPRRAHEHQPVAHDGHLVQLDDLLVEQLHELDPYFIAVDPASATEVVVLHFRLLHPGEQVGDYARVEG